MSDVLDNDGRPAPRWLMAAAVVVVVGLVTVSAWRWNHTRETSSGRNGLVPSPSGSAERFFPEPTRAANVCGGDVEQPLMKLRALPPDTHLRLLVGDRDLRMVDVDAGTAQLLTTRTDSRSFTTLVAEGQDVVTVLSNPCSAASFGHGEVGVVDPDSGAVTSRGRGDYLLPGSPLTVVQFGENAPDRLRELGSQATTALPPGWFPFARTRTAYLASVGSNTPDSSTGIELGVGVPTSPTLTKSFGSGHAVAAAADRLFWVAGECPGPRCMLTWTTLEGTSTAQAVDSYACCGAVSPDGTKLAFRRSRAGGHFGAHPGPPQDIAVLDTKTGRPMQVLNGLVLPAKAGLTLAWSPDGEWLVIGVDLGTGPAVLVWRNGMDRPARVPLNAMGGTTGPPALLVLPR